MEGQLIRIVQKLLASQTTYQRFFAVEYTENILSTDRVKKTSPHLTGRFFVWTTELLVTYWVTWTNQEARRVFLPQRSSPFSHVSCYMASRSHIRQVMQEELQDEIILRNPYLAFLFRNYCIPWITEHINSGFNQKQDISSRFPLSYL